MIFVGLFISNIKSYKIKSNNVFPKINDSYFRYVYDKFGKSCGLSMVFACKSIIDNLGYGKLYSNLISFLIEVYSENKYNLTTELFIPILTNFVENYPDFAFPIINYNNFFFKNIFSNLEFILENLGEQNKNEIELLETMKFILKCYQKYPNINDQICLSLSIDFLADAMSKLKYQNSLISVIDLILLKLKSTLPDTWVLKFLLDQNIDMKLKFFIEEGSYNIKIKSLDLLIILIRESDDENLSFFDEHFLKSVTDFFGNVEPKFDKKIIKLLSVILEKATEGTIPTIISFFNDYNIYEILEDYSFNSKYEGLSLSARDLLLKIRNLKDIYDKYKENEVFLSI